MKVIAKATLKGAFTGACLGMIPVIHVSHAQQVVDPAAAAANRSALTQSLNGTAVQNIAAPNAGGLSHNKFTTFNVDPKGLVINNSSINAISNIGGAVVANPHLAGGEARLILNEVTSGNRSILKGTQELLGGRAAYILANPNGITCDGCGFINFPRATLATGAPVLSNGAISGFTVNGGDLLVGPGGLNATGVDFFDIITRATVLNGRVNANDLSFVLGRNQVDYATLAATPLATAAGEPAPAFALDSSELGGMYAGRIWLRGTEAGVGVRAMGTVAASVSDVSMDVNGKITFKGNAATAVRDVTLKAAQVELDAATVYAGNDTTLQSAGATTLAGGRTGAGRDLRIESTTLTDAQGVRDAGRDLTVQATGAWTVQGSTVQAKRHLTAAADSVALQAGARVMGEADGTDADGSGLGRTRVTATQGVTLQDAALFGGNTVEVAAASLSVDAASNDNGTQGIRGGSDVTVTADSVDNAGLVASDAALTVEAGTVTNRATGLVQGASTAITAGTITNAGDLASLGGLALRTNALTNQTGGAILANGTLDVQGHGAASTSLTNEAGAEVKARVLSVQLDAVANSGQLYGQDSLAITADTLKNHTGASIATPGSLTLQQAGPGGTLANSGTVEGRTLSVTYASVDNAGSGRLFGDDAATLVVSSLTNAGTVASDGVLALNQNGSRGASLANTGTIAGAQLGVYFDTITNDGRLYGASALLAGASILTNRRVIESGGTMGLQVRSLANMSTAAAAADIYAVGDLSITDNHTLANTSATGKVASIVSRDGSLLIDSRSGDAATQSVTNSGGLLFSGQNLTAFVSRQYINQSWVGMRAYTFSNLGNMLLGAPDSTTLLGSAQAVTVRNVDSDIEARTGDIQVNASFLENTTTDSAPVKQEVHVGRRSSGSFEYDGNLDGLGAMVEVYSNCGTFADHFDEGRIGHRCTAGVDMYEEQFTGGPNLAPRAKLIAGRDLTLYIENQALNYISLMSAGRDVNVNGAPGATFENKAEKLRYRESAYVVSYEDGGVESNPGVNCDGDRCFYGYVDGPGPDDALWHKKRFDNISLATDPFYYKQGIASTVQAVGAINIHITDVVNNSTGDRKPNSAPIPSPTPPSTPAAGSPMTPGAVGAQPLGTATLGGIATLGSSPFFVPAASPSSPYLFETNPRLMSLEGLYGSDLLLKSLGLDPTKYMRVGDPYFEQQLLRQQLLAAAGQLFIADGLASENDQFKLLMANAASVSGDLKLRVGVALTAEQLANLKKDIVWMVETVVNGKKVLVPQLYLSDATKAKLADGARFVASNINIKTEGAITNTGAFVASNNITIDAGTTFTNRMGTLVAANGLSIAATGDILNQSGTLRGGNVALESRTGSVVNETLTRDEVVRGAHGQGLTTVVGQTATIESTGNLQIKAAQDITSKGGQVAAGGDAKLEAGRDITFTGIERKSLESSVTNTSQGGYDTTERSSTQRTQVQGSGLTVGGNLDASAKRDIKIEGSSVDVTGDGRLDAGRTLTITAQAETSSSRQDTQTDSWNTSSSEKTTIDRTTGKASTVNFGGSLTIKSGGDTNVVGSEIAVGKDLNVEGIGGNLNVTTFQETTTITSEKKSSSFFGGEAKADAGDNATQSKASAKGTLYNSSEETTRIDSTTHLRSGISVGGNLNAGEGAIKGDVNITGSNIATGGDLKLVAGGDINVLAADDSTTVTKTSKSTSLYVGAEASIDGAGAKLGVEHKESNGSATQTTAQVSGLSSGGNMTLKAGGDFTEQGTQVAAGGDIKVEAASIQSRAAKDTYTETGDSLSVDVSLGITAETGLGGVVGSFMNDKGKADFDMAAASESINGLSVPDAGSVKAELKISTTKTTSTASGSEARTSSFTSGGNVTFTAREGDATFAGTNVEAAKAIEVTAAKGSVNILAAESSDQASKTTTKADVTIGVSMDGTMSGSGSGSKETDASSSTRQTAASFKAGTDLTIEAKKDVTLVGTNLAAGGTASIEAKEGKIDFQAARNTTSASSDSESANASFSANVSGKEGSVGGGGGTMSTRENSSTGVAGSISAGNVVLKSKGDITLEGTNIAARDNASIETQGKVDFKAVEDTYTRTAQGKSAQVDLEAGAKGGGAKVGASVTDESESSSTKRGGTLTASNLTIKAGDGIRLEGTAVDVKQDASIDAGKGKLVVESAVSTRTVRINNDSAEVGLKADVKSQNGQGSVKVESASENTNQVTNQNASIKVGGKADVKAAGGIDVKGTGVTGLDSVIKAGTLDTHGAAVTVEQRQDVNESTKSNTSVSVGVIVPSKKARKEVTDTVQKAKDSKVGTALQNKTEDTKARLGLQTKDEATENKRQNNVAYADRKATEAETRISSDQSKKDQKASYDQQKADDRAAAERDKALKAIDKTAGAPAQDAAKAKIQSEFEAKKQANAETADATKQQNAVAALDARNQYADKTLGRKEAAETKAAESQGRHADDNAKVQVALATKTADEAKEIDARQKQIDRKGEVNAEKAARVVELKADADKAKADNDARKARLEADKTAQEASKAKVDKVLEQQKKDDADIDKQAGLTDAQKADKKAENAKKAQEKVAEARKELEDAREASAKAEADKLQEAVTAREKARADAEQARQETLAKAERDRLGLQPTQDVKDALAKADKARNEKVADLDKKRDDALKDQDKKRDDAVGDARKKRDAELARIAKDTKMTAKDKAAARKKAEQDFAAAETKAKEAHAAEKGKLDAEHDKGVEQADKDQAADANVKAARQKMERDLDQQRDDRLAQAGKEAKVRKELADLDEARRKALAEKAEARAKKDEAVQADDSLSAQDKADKLKANAEEQARDLETVAADHAKKQEATKAARDDEARKAEEAAIDPKLPAADKDAAKKKIADKYDALKKDREKVRDEQVAAAAEAKKQAVEDAKVERDQRVAEAQAAKAYQDAADALEKTKSTREKASEDRKDRELANISTTLPEENKKSERARIEKEAALRKNDLQARHDADVAKAAADRDEKVAQADSERAKAAADLAKQRETEAANKLPATEKAARLTEIAQQHTDAKAKADSTLAAQKKDIEARRDEQLATAERTRRDADIDADTALTAREKQQKKAESEKTFLAAQKAAQAKRDEAKTELARLMTPEEKAAADALAAKAEKEGARVKNPYAFSVKAKYYGNKVRRWKEVVTAFGIDVSTAPPPVQDEEEKQATLRSLLPLAKQFQAQDQVVALRLLQDPAVQAATAIAAAVDAMREEARDAMLKAYTQAETGKPLGVLTVADQRRILDREGIELPAHLPSAEVTRQFRAHLDAAAAALQPTPSQKAEILQGLGVAVPSGKAAEQVYAETMGKGREKAQAQMAGMGLGAAKVRELSGMMER